jgi:hypothetical protein
MPCQCPLMKKKYLLGDERICVYHGAQCAYGEIPQMLLPLLRLNQLTLKLPSLVTEAVITFLLNDYVVHDPPSLQHTKCSLHIFLASLLPLGKPLHFLHCRII